MTSYDTVPPEEHADRMARVLSVACPECGAAAGHACTGPAGRTGSHAPQHAARWDAWYAAHPDGGEQR